MLGLGQWAFRQKGVICLSPSEKAPQLSAWTSLPRKIQQHHVLFVLSCGGGPLFCQQDGMWGLGLLGFPAWGTPCISILRIPQSFQPVVWSHLGRFSCMPFFFYFSNEAGRVSGMAVGCCAFKHRLRLSSQDNQESP